MSKADYIIPTKVWNVLKKDKSFMRKVNETRAKFGFPPIQTTPVPETSLLRTLAQSRAHKIRNNWTRDGGAGFIVQDISRLWKNPDGTITLITEACTLTADPIDFNLRETEEMLKYVKLQRLKQRALELS